MRYLAYGAALAALAASPAAAQSGTADNTLAEIIVTSRQREERVQDVPAAVTGLSAEQIQAAGGLKDIKDLSFLLPGLALVDTGNINAENNIRGAGAGTARTASVDAPIAVLRDGASITGGAIGGRTYVRSDLFDIARIEVTRGPQGALYGVNAVGGVIQAISQRPRETFGGSLSGAWSPEIERYQVDGILNVPIPQANLGLRLGFQRSEKGDGFFKNLFTGKAGDVEDYTAFKGALEWRPTDDLTVFIVADQSDEISPQNILKAVNLRNDPTTPVAQFGPTDPDGPFVYSNNTSNDVNRNVSSLNTRVEWDTPIGKLTAITLLRRRTTAYSADTDNSAPGYSQTPFPAATCATRLCTTLFQDNTEIASQEVRLAGDFGPTLSWIVGASYQGKQSDFFLVSDGRTTSATNLAPSPTGNVASVSKDEELQGGVFGSVSWRATDKLTLDAAARYNHAEKKIDAYSLLRQPSATLNCSAIYVDPLAVFATNPACVRQRNLAEDTFTNTSPAVSAKYELASNWRVFASAGIGYRSGGFNGNSVLDPNILSSYLPEKNVALEIGTKFELGGGFFTLTAFQNNFDNLLVTVDSIGPDAVNRSYRFNAGKAETYGVDFEVFGRRDLEPGWGYISYTAAINYLTGKVQSGPYDGQTVEGSPEWTYTGTLAYVRPFLEGWNFTASASYRGQRGGYTNTTKINNQIDLPKLDLVNASVGVDNGSLRVVLEARNVFDNTYESLRDPTRSFYGDPREVRLTLAYAFGSEARRRP